MIGSSEEVREGLWNIPRHEEVILEFSKCPLLVGEPGTAQRYMRDALRAIVGGGHDIRHWRVPIIRDTVAHLDMNIRCELVREREEARPSRGPNLPVEFMNLHSNLRDLWRSVAFEITADGSLNVVGWIIDRNLMQDELLRREEAWAEQHRIEEREEAYLRKLQGDGEWPKHIPPAALADITRCVEIASIEGPTSDWLNFAEWLRTFQEE